MYKHRRKINDGKDTQLFLHFHCNFFQVMIVKKEQKATPKTADYQPLFFAVKYHSYDTKQYFGKQNQKQLMKTNIGRNPFLLSDIIRCQEEKCKVRALCGKQNKAKIVSLVEELHQLSFTK